MSADLPSRVYVGMLDRSIEVHWASHALLMVTAWFVLVPIAVLAIRYFKPTPTPYGIERGTGRFDRRLIWWTIHWCCLYVAIGVSLLGGGVALILRHGFSGSVHDVWGLATLCLGSLQIISAWLRGTHGGKHGVHSDPQDPSTWHGDHYDMTPRRSWFEAYHKTAGYFTLASACGAVASGLMRYWVPAAAVEICIAIPAALIVSVLLERWQFRQDTYRSVYGSHPDHPYNKRRQNL